VVPVGNLDHVETYIRLYDGTNLTSYQWRYLHTTGNVDVADATAGWVVIGSPGIMREGYGAFVTTKMVIDPLSGKYAHLFFNNHVYDASGYGPSSSADSTRPCMEVRLTAWNSGDYGVHVAVDDVIVTQNEPL